MLPVPINGSYTSFPGDAYKSDQLQGDRYELDMQTYESLIRHQ